SPAISIDQKAHSRNPRSTVATITEIYDYLRVLFARTGTPHCVVCDRPIQRLTVEEIVNLILAENKGEELRVMAPVIRGRKGEYYQLLYNLYNSGFAKARIDGKIHSLSDQIVLKRYGQHTIEVVVDTLSKWEMADVKPETRQRIAEAVETSLEQGDDTMVVLFGTKREHTYSAKFSCPHDGFAFPEIEPRLFSFNSPYGACQACDGLGTKELFSEDICEVCGGARLRPEARHVLVDGKRITDVTSMNIDEAFAFFTSLDLNASIKRIAENVLKEVANRLKFMQDVGLNYLTLDRKAGTLSGGEAQRIRLASQIGSRLVGALYVLDEPTIGLHQRDNAKLLATLKELREIGNTIIVVEHDEETILESDYMVELGPGAGVHGGSCVAAGPMPDILENKQSLTAAYLRGDKSVPIPKQRRAIGKDPLTITGATEHNLKNVTVEIPLRRFVCVTGVSGSGKSTLVEEILYKAVATRNHGHVLH
ncbi:ABC-ATPase UvrA, partial [Candidatus Uhrbacteria bacterium]|nr:ABC-ATPase UvrA [Candidatus Uhrbacteria bacterium]